MFADQNPVSVNRPVPVIKESPRERPLSLGDLALVGVAELASGGALMLFIRSKIGVL